MAALVARKPDTNPPVPGMPSHEPSTSVKLPGREGLRIDVLAPGPATIPYYDYMLEDSQKAVMLARGCCIPIRLPRLDRTPDIRLVRAEIGSPASQSFR